MLGHPISSPSAALRTLRLDHLSPAAAAVRCSSSSSCSSEKSAKWKADSGEKRRCSPGLASRSILNMGSPYLIRDGNQRRSVALSGTQWHSAAHSGTQWRLVPEQQHGDVLARGVMHL